MAALNSIQAQALLSGRNRLDIGAFYLVTTVLANKEGNKKNEKSTGK